jgi:NAD(P)-dependent dehydrogenase (short-subunit alcohol dehydrogenase family)
MQSPGEKKSYVLVTGSSTGIGKACALTLAKNGFVVLAGVRREEDGRNLEAAAGGNLRGILLDIADPDSVSAAAGKIGEIVGEAGLAGIVNNAGIGVHGPIEFLSREDWRKQFDVNVFGHADVTRAFLPLVRKYVARQGPGAGRIVFIGSIAGRVSLPIMGPYCASKHAIAGLAGSLRLELYGQGIHVCLIEPGAIQSEIWRKAHEYAATIKADAPARELYGKSIDGTVSASLDSAKNAIPADVVARLVWGCMTSRKPPLRRTVGRDAKFAAFVRWVLPEAWFRRILVHMLKIG